MKKVIFSAAICLLAFNSFGFKRNCVPATLSCGISTVVCGATTEDLIMQVLLMEQELCDY